MVLAITGDPNMFNLTPTEVVSAALITSHRNGVPSPHRENIREAMYEIDKKVNGEFIKGRPIEDFINTRVFGKTPHHLYKSNLAIVVPVNISWYLDECKEPTTESKARSYLPKQNKPTYGFLFPPKESLMLVVFSFKKQDDGQRKIKTSSEYTMNIAEKEAISLEQARNIVDSGVNDLSQSIIRIKGILDSK
jgi:hypothetical protein